MAGAQFQGNEPRNGGVEGGRDSRDEDRSGSWKGERLRIMQSIERCLADEG